MLTPMWSIDSADIDECSSSENAEKLFFIFIIWKMQSFDLNWVKPIENRHLALAPRSSHFHPRTFALVLRDGSFLDVHASRPVKACTGHGTQ